MWLNIHANTGTVSTHASDSVWHAYKLTHTHSQDSEKITTQVICRPATAQKKTHSHDKRLERDGDNQCKHKVTTLDSDELFELYTFREQIEGGNSCMFSWNYTRNQQIDADYVFCVRTYRVLNVSASASVIWRPRRD